jgi:hypothetical protein
MKRIRKNNMRVRRRLFIDNMFTVIFPAVVKNPSLDYEESVKLTFKIIRDVYDLRKELLNELDNSNATR